MPFDQIQSPKPIKSEQEILDPAVRKRLIDEILGPENQSRRAEALKRFECYKDQTKEYVTDALLRQFDLKTVREMSYTLANISVVKKIINKLAMVYSFGVERKLDTDEATQALNELESFLEFDSKMKKANRFLKLQKNIFVYPKPIPVGDKWTLKLDILQPYLYDVVPDFFDKEKPMVVILSDFKKHTRERFSLDPASEGRGVKHIDAPLLTSDRINQQIGDKDDSLVGDQEFIWWTDSFHFVTDKTGAIISPEIENPIGMLPMVNFALDQDGAFWATGGDDLVDGGILINSMITHFNHIGVTQGYGQFWMKGEKVPTSVAMGPSKMIRMEWTGDEKEPSLGFASTDPKLTDLRENAVMYTALLLTTNNLSTSGVSTKLDGVSLPSGIALMIDKSESMEDINDQRSIFVDKEPEIWRRIAAWKEFFSSKRLLVEDLAQIKTPAEIVPSLKFSEPKPLVTESEKLDNIQKRKDLGISTLKELIQIDNPDLDEEQIAQKIEELKKEKAERVSQFKLGVRPDGEQTTFNETMQTLDS